MSRVPPPGKRKSEGLPVMCPYHAGLYATRLEQIDKRIHHPGAGRKALIRQAVQIADQCCRKSLGLKPRYRP